MIATQPAPEGAARWLCHIGLLAMLWLAMSLFVVSPAHAVKVLVVVNDLPITDYDVRQRMKLDRILGVRYSSRAVARKRALQSLIDTAVLEGEARRQGLQLEETRVEAAIQRMARGMGGMDKLRATLRRNGLSMDFLRAYVRGQMIFQILAAKKGQKFTPGKVSDAEVEQRLKKMIKANAARVKPFTVWRLRQINLPLGDVAPVMRDQVLLARAVEARQIMQRYRGCATARKAASGIFNVNVSRVIEADPRKLPPQLKKAMRKAGAKGLVGPIRTPQGVQLLAFCGTRTIKPKVVVPKDMKNKLRQQIRAALRQEKMGRQIEAFMQQFRDKAVIEWRSKRS